MAHRVNVDFVGFILKKCVLDAQEMLQDIPPEDLVIQPLHDVQDEHTFSTLGLLWDQMAANLRIKVKQSLSAAIRTKSKVMSCIAQTFGPLGLVGPVSGPQ